MRGDEYGTPVEFFSSRDYIAAGVDKVSTFPREGRRIVLKRLDGNGTVAMIPFVKSKYHGSEIGYASA
jgi:hypothetical protein